MPTALITGSLGLVGSAAVNILSRKGWEVHGLDNDMRQHFFGPSASVRRTQHQLAKNAPSYVHHEQDVRDGVGLERIFRDCKDGIDLIIHAAAQPSHDWAASDPLMDFAINAQATVQLLHLTRQFYPAAAFVFLSTNKVYGDAPNRLPLLELAERWEIDPQHTFARQGINENMSIDQNLHSLFGCSKLAADVFVQEFGRYFGMKTGCFRCGCITGGEHAGAEQHGFLAYLMHCAVNQQPYKINGYNGKQVRDIIHATDLVHAIEHFYASPRMGEVYNMGGGRHCSCSIQEAIALCEEATGSRMKTEYRNEPRRGDHIWWISDVSKFQGHYPAWRYEYNRERLFADLLVGARSKQSG